VILKRVTPNAEGRALSAADFYGMTAFIVGRRSRELGIRLALGATTARATSDFAPRP